MSIFIASVCPLVSLKGEMIVVASANFLSIAKGYATDKEIIEVAATERQQLSEKRERRLQYCADAYFALFPFRPSYEGASIQNVIIVKEVII